MDFIRYAESAAQLLNADLSGVDGLVRHLGGREWLHEQCTERDCVTLRRFCTELRPVFEASGHDDTQAVIDGLNALLSRRLIPLQRGVMVAAHVVYGALSDHSPARVDKPAPELVGGRP